MVEAKKSNFTATCSRLSQYLKENRMSSGDLGVLDSKPVVKRPPTTLNLLARLEASAESRADGPDTSSVSCRNAAKEPEPANAPLTIFFGGKVMVFKDLSPENVADIMNLAMKGSSATVSSARFSTSDMPLPMSRRASLHRFLEKRKARINSKAPYQINGCSSKAVGSTDEPQDAKSWLGLGKEISNLS